MKLSNAGMKHVSTVYVIARDANGPLFASLGGHPSPWVESPIMARFLYNRAFMEEELISAKLQEYPDINDAFIEKVKITCEI